MFLRTFSLATLGLMVSACGAGETPEPEGDSIACAIGPGAEFSNVCTLEILSPATFLIHHPEGGFRRFIRDAEGTISEADGAAKLDLTQVPSDPGASYEFTVDGDRYRIPVDAFAAAIDE